MVTTKTKTDYHINLEEAKKHLRLDFDFTDDDQFIQSLIKSSVNICENYIQKEIATTNVNYKLYDFAGSELTLNGGNLISVDGITGDTSEINSSKYEVLQYHSTFIIEFDDVLSYPDKYIYVNTTQGYNSNNLPFDIKAAILIQLADLYDHRSSYEFNNIKKNDTVQSLLTPYKGLYYV